MGKFEVGAKVRIANKTHVGAIPYQGRRGEVVDILTDPPHGYFIRLEGESESLFFLDWEVLKEVHYA